MLTGELEAFIQETVRSGRYLDASDVVRDALRALEKQEFESPELEAEILKGLEGPTEPYGPEMWERLSGRWNGDCRGPSDARRP